jgi:hypothetical protein
MLQTLSRITIVMDERLMKPARMLDPNFNKTEFHTKLKSLQKVAFKLTAQMGFKNLVDVNLIIRSLLKIF